MIVPTHRGAERIEGLLDSLAAQSVEHEVIVVDNGSSDGTSEVLARRPLVEVIRLDRNVGFGPAINVAARRAEGDAIVLVNDDCVLDPGFIAEITAPLDRRSDTVMAAGVLLDHEDPNLIDTAGMELDPTLLVFDYLHGEPVGTLGDRPADPIGPSGAAAAFDRDAFLEVGGFDEALFAYWEDVDLVLRMRLLGARCRLAPAAMGTHLHSATIGSGSTAKNSLMGYGRGYLLRKWGVMAGRRAARVIVEDTVICLGQAVFDRNLSGTLGRIRGWKAATPSFPYPGDALNGHASPGVLSDLRRRFRRRRRLRGRRPGAPRPPGT